MPAPSWAYREGNAGPGGDRAEARTTEPATETITVRDGRAPQTEVEPATEVLQLGTGSLASRPTGPPLTGPPLTGPPLTGPPPVAPAPPYGSAGDPPTAEIPLGGPASGRTVPPSGALPLPVRTPQLQARPPDSADRQRVEPPRPARPTSAPPASASPRGASPTGAPPTGAPPTGAPPTGAPPRGRRPGSPEPADLFSLRPRRSRRRWWIPAAAAAAVLILLLGGAGAVVLTAPEVPRGTTVAGIDIGDRSRQEAEASLAAALTKRAADPVAITIGDGSANLDPVKAGLTVDIPATVSSAIDQAGPTAGLFGGGEVAPVVTVDLAKLDNALSGVSAADPSGLVKPAIRYSKLKPVPTYPRAGRGAAAESAAQALKDQWLQTSPVRVPVVDITPKTTKAELESLLEDLAEPAVSAPVTVRTPNGEFDLQPEAIAASLLMEPDVDGAVEPRVDPAKLAAALKDELAEVEKKPVDATVKISGAKPVVVEQIDGESVDLAALGEALLPVLRRAEGRTVAATMSKKAPELTTDKVRKLGIVEKVSSFTTRFTGGEDRNRNILLVADEVDGAVVLPGKTFSLNGHTGPRGTAQGYVQAPVILGGKIKNEVGGGISQFATTLFNAVWYSGLEDVSHQPHGYYISRYPSVVEATVYYPSLDLKFRNDSTAGVLIDTSYTSSSVTVTFWGTKRYEISTVYGPKTDHTQPTTQTLREDDCNETAGIPGFTQTAYRVFTSGGNEVKRQRYTWRYKAEPKFVCEPLTPAPSNGPG